MRRPGARAPVSDPVQAAGMKTNLRTILDVGGQAIVLIVAETTFLAIFILAGLHLLN